MLISTRNLIKTTTQHCPTWDSPVLLVYNAWWGILGFVGQCSQPSSTGQQSFACKRSSIIIGRNVNATPTSSFDLRDCCTISTKNWPKRDISSGTSGLAMLLNYMHSERFWQFWFSGIWKAISFSPMWKNLGYAFIWIHFTILPVKSVTRPNFTTIFNSHK